MTAGFLEEPPINPQTQALFDQDLEETGYVWNVSQLWAYQPHTMEHLFELMSEAFLLLMVEPALRGAAHTVRQERLKSGEQAIDLLALLLRCPRRLNNDLRLIRLGRVVSVRVRRECRRCGHRASHPVSATLKSLR